MLSDKHRYSILTPNKIPNNFRHIICFLIYGDRAYPGVNMDPNIPAKNSQDNGDDEHPAVAPNALRTAMGRFLTGVTIVTTRDANGEPYGLTVNSFNSVSLDPPLILWSLDNRHDRADFFRDSGGFTVNIMPADADALIFKFANTKAERFENTDWHWGVTRQPVLDAAMTSLECRMWAEYPGGDHSIFVGEVVDIKTGDGQPAAYFNGQLSAFPA
jgi:Conserved protein/domain typically associated with flavoprotein oxygenases, DIM6/NTAB family